MAVSELELRRRAVELHVQGWGATAIGDELGRSREWVRKWVGRWNAEGDDGLVDRSKRPHHSPSQLDETVVAEIVAVRDSLDDDPHANVGAVAVQAEMERIGAVDPPSLSSIKRVWLRPVGLAATGLSSVPAATNGSCLLRSCLACGSSRIGFMIGGSTAARCSLHCRSPTSDHTDCPPSSISDARCSWRFVS